MRIGIIAGICAAAIVAAAFGWMRMYASPRSERAADISKASVAWQNPATVLQPIDAMAFVDRRVGFPHVTSTRLMAGDRVIAGVVNHHVLAADVLERFWEDVAATRPHLRRIIIISPDHYAQGRKYVSVHERPYATDEGLVTVDVTSTRVLARLQMVGEENGVMFEREHGIGALIPFMHHAIPAAQIVPIAIRGTVDRALLPALGKEIAKLIDDQTMIVISSDMSHYLDEATALKNDQTTMGWFRRRDEQALATATDRNTDNGAAFAVLFEALRGRQLAFTLIDHAISTAYNGPKDNTTSYVTGVWSMGN